MTNGDNLFNAFELKGTWSFAGISEFKYFGILNFDPELGPTLQLMGDVWTGEDTDINEVPSESETIIGKCEGKVVTLVNCIVDDDFSFSLPVSTGTRSIYAEYALISSNVYFLSAEDIEFTSVSVRYTLLDSWMQHYGSRVFHQDVREGFENGRFTPNVQFNHFSKEYFLTDEFRISFGYDARLGRSSLNGLFFENFATITCRTERPSLFFLSHLPYVRDYLPSFLTLATGHANFPLSIVGVIDDSDQRPAKCEIYFRVPGYVDNQSRTMPRSMLFQFHEFEENLEQYIMAWIDIWNQSPHLITLFTKPYVFSVDPYTQLVELVTVAEVCLSVLYGENNVEKTITHLCRKHEDIPQLLDIVDCYDEFGKRVKDIRNDMQHEGTTDAEFEEVKVLARKMRLLVKMCLLRSIGCASETIGSLIESTNEYASLKRSPTATSFRPMEERLREGQPT